MKINSLFKSKIGNKLIKINNATNFNSLLINIKSSNFTTTQNLDYSILNVSPLDGRYKKQTEDIKEFFSKKNIEEKTSKIQTQVLSLINKSTKNDIKYISNRKDLLSQINYYILLEDALTSKYSEQFNSIIELISKLENLCDKYLINSISHLDLNEKVALKKELNKYKSKLVDNQNQLLIELNRNSGNDINKENHIIELINKLDNDVLRNKYSRIFGLLLTSNLLLMSFSKDIWNYISRGAFVQKVKEGEIGSSTMPHKVNPIDFENAEGNLGLSNSYLQCFVEILNSTRFQGDGLDYTVYDNIGSALGYSFVSFASLTKGLNKITPNKEVLKLH